MAAHDRRFKRQLRRFERRMPYVGGAMRTLTRPGRFWLRLPVALVLILGGLLWFLPVVGFWMLPLGVLLLALDIRGLRPLVGGVIVRCRYQMRRFARRKD